MPLDTPLPRWSGEDAFIIGGGPSLRGFDWKKLERLNTIGCNQAFQLGSGVCKICMFGDAHFFEVFWKDIEAQYDGWVVTNAPGCWDVPWLHIFPRVDEGLATNAIGWNGNTGAAAINLALILGAKRVFLLGFDTAHGSTPDKTHWHDAAIESQGEEHYEKFRGGFYTVLTQLSSVFPGAAVFNVSDGASRLKCFPIMPTAEALRHASCISKERIQGEF